MVRADFLHIVMHCSSPDARAWLYDEASQAVQDKATADLGPAAEVGDYETVEDCLDKSASVDLRNGDGSRKWSRYHCEAPSKKKVRHRRCKK